MDGPIWTIRLREMLGVFIFLHALMRVLGSYPGHPGLLQSMLN